MHTASATRLDEARSHLARDGYYYASDLPAGFDHLDFVQEFGKLSVQYHGDAIGTIRAKPGFDDVYHAQNTKELFPHTECYEYPGLPPRHLALWCIAPARDGGGCTQLACFERFFREHLSAGERALLAATPLRYSSTPGLQEEGLSQPPVHHPLVQVLPDGRRVYRYSTRCMTYRHDARLVAVVDRFGRYFEAQHVGIRWRKGALLIWDNHRMAHARTAFEDRQRELARVWIA